MHNPAASPSQARECYLACVVAQMGIRPGAQKGLFGMNQAMQSSFAGGNLMDGRGSRQEG
ncbi:hypothetical protein CTI12_AA118220 [Artemisia annua]|uniref:Uncharacterized protein n=1 Tax=Artemisia annua TaxID=35608 RepID=A0A2U1PSS8_ARTAN|nr:hypothetical protein CTI12_AA118220 [Artemisia annua]